MTIQFQPTRHTHVTYTTDASSPVPTKPSEPCKSKPSRASGITPMGVAKAAIAAASVLLLPARALASSADPAARQALQPPLPLPDGGRATGISSTNRRLLGQRPDAHPSLITPPDGTNVYLAPKHTLGQNNFVVLDGKAGVGHQTVLANQTAASATQLVNVKPDGRIVFDSIAANQTLCLDVFGAKYANGTVVDPWPCNGQSNQRWNFTATHDNFYTISPVGEPAGCHYCLDVFGNKIVEKTPIQLYTCNGGPNQQWTLVSGG